MGIFGKKKEPAKVAVAKSVRTGEGTQTSRDLHAIIKKPRITEKAALLAERNVYTFEIQKGATKYDVRDAVVALYNVTPVRVHIVNKKPKKTLSRARGRYVGVEGLRKAYVYLKKDDRIELV